MSDNHWFGRPVPDTATHAWGARAIYTPNSKEHPLDFLHDRQSRRGATIPQEDWEAVYQELVEDVKRRRPSTDSDHVFRARSKKRPGYVHEFSPNGSYGYLYCAIWKEP